MNSKYLKTLEFDKIINNLEYFCVSKKGKELAKNITLHNDIGMVNEVQNETSDGLEVILKKGNLPLGRVPDIDNHIKRLKIGGILTPKELLEVCSNLKSARQLLAFAKEDDLVDKDNILLSLILSLEERRTLENDIYRSIDSEDRISDDASSKLRSIRRQILNMQNSIKEKLNSMIRSTKYQKYMQDSIVTMRGDRYVIPVKQEYKSEIPGLMHDSSSSGATIFIEPMVVVETNNEIKQLFIKENEEIERILIELTNRVSEIDEILVQNSKLITEIDFINAKAKLSLKYDCIRPIVNNKGIINIKKGRHPLIPKEEIVPIDFWIGKTFKTVVVTGPNTGGKTVTLKTTGLLSLMAQAGLHVPAKEGTELAIFEHIFADIGDEQSIEQSLSTFSSHMKNIVSILNEANSSSLVLFDELGAGTDPTEGAALAIGILEYLNELEITTIATTHYSELKMYAISNDYVENACCEFNIETLKPTYKLLIGIPGKSNAFAISKSLGLSDYVLNKSKDFLSNENIKFEDVLHNIEKNRSDMEKEKQETQQLLNEVEKLKKELERQKEKFDDKKEKILQKAKEEAKRIVHSAKENAENTIKELTRLRQEKNELEGIKFAEKARIGFKKDIDNLDAQLIKKVINSKTNMITPETVSVGQEVHIKSLGQKGNVTTNEDKNGDFMVQVGIMKINVNIKDVYIDLSRNKDKKGVSSYVKKVKTAKSIVKNEIDLRGENIEEGIVRVDKYLDDVSIAGLNEVTIIHGKGTGVLRNGIQDFLKSHPHVKNFRLGKYGEGESGVTIVTLK